MSFSFEELVIEFAVKSASALVVPPLSVPSRADDLWQSTCFEIFLRGDGSESYLEFNLSPSMAWAAYVFGGYRRERQNLPMRFDPEMEISSDGEYFSLRAELDAPKLLGDNVRMGLSAVIEEATGAKSLWALAHPPGAPDFHHPDCFVLELPPPDAA